MDNGFQSNRITIFREQYDAISKLPVGVQGKVYKALMDYNFTGTIPKLDATAQLAFDLIKAGLDVSLNKQRAGQAGGNQKACNARAESKQLSSKTLADEESKDLVESKSCFCSIESEENTTGKREIQSYEEIMEDLCVEENLRPKVWEFIKHCQVNGHTLINSKLEEIILSLDYAYGTSTSQKIFSLQKAINSGYFDVAENNHQLEKKKDLAIERELKARGVLE